MIMTTRHIIATVLLSMLPILLLAGPPDWQLNNTNDFGYSANLTAQLVIDGETRNNPLDQVACFYNGELRGSSFSQEVDGQVLHFLTVFSNQPIGEQMEVRVYLAQEDQVVIANELYPFAHLSVNGTLEAPYLVNASTDGDLLISMDALPPIRRMQGMAFPQLDMEDYLVQADEDPILWEVENSSNFDLSFQGSVLNIQLADPGFTGTESLTVTATEQTDNAYSAQAELVITVDGFYAGPQFDSIPSQHILPGAEFESFSLDTYETAYSGEALQFGYKPLPAPGQPQVLVSWVIDGSCLPNTMSVVAEAGYTPEFPMDAPGDRLAVFIDGELRGAASPKLIDGKPMIVMQVYHTEPAAEMELRYFNEELGRMMIAPGTFNFINGGSLGSPDDPFFIDFSPLGYELDAQTGAVDVFFRQEGWQGAELVQFSARDEGYPNELRDSIATYFCAGPDSDEDGLCDFLDPAPQDPCVPNPNSPSCDADGDGLFADTDPDDNDPCNPTVEAILMELNDPGCEGGQGGSLSALISSPFCGDGRFAVSIIRTDGMTVTLSNSAADGDTLMVQGLPEGTYRLEIEPSEPGTCLFGPDCFPIVVDDFATLNPSDSEPPVLVCRQNTIAVGENETYVLQDSDVIDFQASSDACGITEVEFPDFVLSCEDVEQTYIFDVFASDAAGNTSQCQASITIVNDSELPDPWEPMDIGSQPQESDYRYNPCATQPGGTYIIETNANLSFGDEDNAGSISQERCGDLTFTVKVESVAGGFAGITLRDGDGPGAKQISLYTDLNFMRSESRVTENGNKQILVHSSPTGIWLRLRRSGNIFIAYASQDGINYQVVRALSMNMSNCVKAGLIAYSSGAGQAVKTVISSISLDGEAPFGTSPEAEVIQSQLPSHSVTSGYGEVDVRVAPNPNPGQFTVRLGQPLAHPVDMLLYDAAGQKLGERTLPAGSQIHEWQELQLSRGFYILELRDGQQLLGQTSVIVN